MTERKLARIVAIDSLSPIPDADAIEVAHVGGWKVVVKKGEFAPGDSAVYFEIDSFLPEGNPAWQFLVDKSARNFEERRGHVLRSLKLRGQVSQGLLLGLDVLPKEAGSPALGDDVSEMLGVKKYEAPIPAELAGIALGAFPSRVPKTDQERIQNLANELAQWQQAGRQGALTWEVTEKLEGSSCTWAWLDNELHVCSRNLDLAETEGNSLWRVARETRIEEKLRTALSGYNLALQGEIVGNGVQGNPYKFQGQKLYVFAVYDVDLGRYLFPEERRNLVASLGLEHAPVIDEAFVLDDTCSMERLLEMADGESRLRKGQLREGLVFKANGIETSFKAISNKYLLKHGG